MERLGVWTLIFLIAIMDFGHIAPGFEQIEDEDFVPVPISGTSGRSVRANVIIAARVWTAPVTGPVIFDNGGSKFHTLLGIHDDNDTLIVSNFDLGTFTLASEVRFTAQQGQTYHIAVDGYGGATGDIVLNWRAPSVRSGPTRPLREQVFANPGPGQPSYVVAGDNAGLQFWMHPGGTVRQSLYESTDGMERVRIFYDEATDLPRAVLNEVSGHWLSIRERGPDRVDFMQYDRSGNYLHGFAVFSKGRYYYTGEIEGVPAHDGNAISGRLIRHRVRGPVVLR